MGSLFGVLFVGDGSLAIHYQWAMKKKTATIAVLTVTVYRFA